MSAHSTEHFLRIRRIAATVAASATVLASLAAPLAASADIAGPVQLLTAPEGIAAPIPTTHPAAPEPRKTLPKQLNPNEKNRWVLVDLSAQTITFFENGEAIRKSLVSTGLPGTPTNQGTFKVWRRVYNERMVGDGYDLSGVLFTQYFNNDMEALHLKWWNNVYGAPSSHGCVNMPYELAKYAWDFGFIGMVVKVVP